MIVEENVRLKMQIIKDIPFDQDPVDVDAAMDAKRIGNRIKKIRKEKGRTKSWLAETIGISSNMLQKYENGQRKPKIERLKQIAQALGVETIALANPIMTSTVGSMYALFEFEEEFGLSMVEKDGHVYLHFSSDGTSSINEFVETWYKKKQNISLRMNVTNSEEKEKINSEYNNWKWTFPKSIYRNPSREEKIKEKEALEKRIEQLKKELNDK